MIAPRLKIKVQRKDDYVVGLTTRVTDNEWDGIELILPNAIAKKMRIGRTYVLTIREVAAPKKRKVKR